jgi:uncharacterized protein (DUF1697 family)
MARYVAFLRAINVGGHVVKMDALRAHFENMGFQKVATFIASGNVVFDTPLGDAAALEKTIEQQLKVALGYEVVTFLRTPKEIAKLLQMQPFPQSEIDAPDATLYIGFLSSPPSKAAIDKLMAFSTRETELRVRNREVYWLARAKLSESKFTGAKMERVLGMPATIRNLTTVQKVLLVATAEEAPPVTGERIAFGATDRPRTEAKPTAMKKRSGDRRTAERRKRDS